MNLPRLVVCAGCGTGFLSNRKSQRYCSVPCTTSRGPWSYPASRPSDPRVLDVTKG